jgi:hypothetical protein
VSGQEDRRLKIAAVGMDERMQNALSLFFKGPGKNSCILVEENFAELSIVDLDGYGSKGLLEKHMQQYPDRPVILLSLQEQNMNGAIFVRKPLNPKQLMSALDKVKAQLSSNAQAASSTQSSNEQQADIQDGAAQRSLDSAANQSVKSTAPKSNRKTHKAAMGLDERSAKAFIGSAHDIDPNDGKQASAAQYNPKDFFQYHLKRAFFLAESKVKPVLLETEQGTMTFSPGSKPIRVEMSDQWLRSLSVVPIIDGAVSISLMNGNQVLHEDAPPVLVSREEMLWKTALWASRGRVPVGSSFTTPVYLRRWPNMPRLLVFPHALRIAALWVSKPHSLINTAEVLNVPQRYVFAFYSAAHAIGLAASTERAVDTLFEPPPEHPHRRRSLFNRILNHLKGQ